MAALLRLAAMLMSHAVHPLRMLLTLLPRECHTDVERDRLPAMEDGNQPKETDPAAATSHSIEALMVSRPRSGRPSNHEGGLTTISSPLIPARAWTQGSHRSLFRRDAAARSQSKPLSVSWIPAFAGTSGEELLATPRR